MPNRKVIDGVKNSQGEEFVDFLRSVNMWVVNGRKGKDAFHLCVQQGMLSGGLLCGEGRELQPH